MKKLSSITILLIALIFIASCSSDEPESSNVRKDIELSEPSRAIAKSMDNFYINFTIDAAKHIDATPSYQSKNVATSPLSASIVMAMMANAVDGELKNEIVNYLGASDIDGLNSFANTLINTLPTIDRKTKLSLANAVWTNHNFTLNTDFSSLATANFNSTLQTFDPTKSEATANTINNWCSQNTQGLIPEIITPGDITPSLTVMMLNAMYFKSQWAIENYFNKNDTKRLKFHGLSGETLTEIMKSTEHSLTYYTDENLEYISIPFGNRAFNMEIILPKADKSILDPTILTPQKYTHIKTQSQTFNAITVLLPKFKINQSFGLDDILTAAGINHLNDAKFTLFTQQLNGAIHFKQAVSVEVNEKGAEAAAVTTGWGDTLMPNPGEPITFNADRPFYFLITEQSTGACLISGRIVDL